MSLTPGLSHIDRFKMDIMMRAAAEPPVYNKCIIRGVILSFSGYRRVADRRHRSTGRG